ncbi:MAG: extracellular solute-binding protein [Eubacteriales bacterium]|jgi:hypothetical protein
MNNKMIRIICFVLPILFCFFTTAGCSEKTDKSDGTKTEDITSAIAETTQADPFDMLAANAPDLEGQTLNFLTRPFSGNTTAYVIYTDICAAETTGEPLNDAIYARNQRVAEKYNVNFTWSEGDASHVQKTVLAQDDVYDFINIALVSHISLANSGHLTDLNTIAALDLAQPYWDANCSRLMSVCGKLYLTMGEINTMDDRFTWCYYFNKALAEDYGLESPYDAVLGGTWTFDKMQAMAQSTAADINGDSVMNQEDSWGILSENYGFYLTVLGSGQRCIEKDGEDKPVFSMNNDRMIAALEKVHAIYGNENVTFLAENWYSIASNNVWSEFIYPMFMNNQALFFMGHLDLATTTFRDMENPYGIIPTPKLDEEQENFWCSGTEYGMTAISIPVTNTDYETTSTVLEALAAASVTTITPAYYDTVLISKGLRDEQSPVMLEIIMNSKTFDLGFLNDWGGSKSLCSGLISAGGKFASVIAAAEEKVMKGLEKAVSDYENR